MGFTVTVDADRIRVGLSGWDGLMNLRRSVDFARTAVTAATAAPRGDLERLIDHRALGRGTHDGAGRPGRRRVGTMLGRAVSGKQFWAVPASGPDLEVLVIDFREGRFARAVLAVDEPSVVAASLPG